MLVVLLTLLIKVVTNLTRFQDLDQTQICMTFQISIKMLILNQMQIKIHSLDFKTQVHHFLNNYHLNVKVIILKTLYQSLIHSRHQLIGSWQVWPMCVPKTKMRASNAGVKMSLTKLKYRILSLTILTK